MSHQQESEIYDSSESAIENRTHQKQFMSEKIEEFEPERNTTQQLVELIRRHFKNIAPETIIESAYYHLGLHQRQHSRDQSSSLNAKSLVQNPIHRQGGPRKRGRPRKTYQEEKREENLKQVSQYQLYNQNTEQSKNDKERQFAQILIEEGYGVSNARKRAAFEFQTTFYYNCLRYIMYNSFKKLEEKVRTQCKEKVFPSEDHKTMKFRTELCTFDKWLPPDQSQTFKEYIKSVYNLNPEPVSKGKTVRLYRNILARWEKMKNYDGRYREPTVNEKKLQS